MPLYRLAQPFDGFSGTVSGQSGDSKLVLFSTPKAAGVARRWVSPANPQSTNQMLIRGYQTAAAVAYSAISQAQAALWIAAADQINRTNVLGLDYTLSGINLYVMINVYRQIDVEAIIDDVPTILQPPIPTVVTSVTLTTATELGVVAQVPGLETSGQALCRVSVPLPSDVYNASANDVRMIGPLLDVIEDNGAGTITWALDIASGDYAVGDPVGVMITPLSEFYFPGTPFLESNIAVVAP